jgi:hypothetical protein
MSKRFFGPVPARHGRRKSGPQKGTTVQVRPSIAAAGYSKRRAIVNYIDSQSGAAGRTRVFREYHNVTPFTGPVLSKTDAQGDVPGLQAGNSGNRRPDTHSHISLQGSPSSSQETCVRARYVSGWIVSVYLSRGPQSTQHLSSCLVTSASNVHGFPGRRIGRGL